MAGDGAHVLLYTAEGQALRIDGDAVNPQATGTATGVAGIALKAGDRLLGAAVVPKAAADEKRWQVAIVSTAGYGHRAHLAEFPALLDAALSAQARAHAPGADRRRR